jgi:uncharacterized membrane protein YphA (DoxX/SURF4 family)
MFLESTFVSPVHLFWNGTCCVRISRDGVRAEIKHRIVFHHVKRKSYEMDISSDDPQTIEAGPTLMSSQWIRCGSFSSVFLRFALGLSFLSAVADRFGLWGVFGQPNVAWGNFSRFADYTFRLNWYVPAGMIPTLAVISTGAEILFGLLLVIGWHTRTTALLSGILLMAFGVAMTLALGVEAPLNSSVFSAAAGASLLTNCPRFPFSVDQFLLRKYALNKRSRTKSPRS